MLLNRDAILNADDLPFEDVEVPEWGGTVRVRGLTSRERDDFEAGSLRQRGQSYTANLANMRARLVSSTLIDEDGKRLFTEADAKALGDKSSRIVARLFRIAQRLSGLTAEDVEELAGKSEPTQSDDSDSD